MKLSKISIGSILAAIGASLCCSLPLVATFVGFGVLGTIGNLFSEYRIYFLIVTGFLLLSVYYVELRKSFSECDCESGEHKKRLLSRFPLILLTVLILTLSFLPEITSAFQTTKAKPKDYTKVALVKIGGMNCQSCAKHIEKALEKRPEISGAFVKFQTALAEIYVRKHISDEAITEIVLGAGYKPGKIRWKPKSN